MADLLSNAPEAWAPITGLAAQVQTFNRGWNFNAGLAVVSAQTTASPDIRADAWTNFQQPLTVTDSCALVRSRVEFP